MRRAARRFYPTIELAAKYYFSKPIVVVYFEGGKIHHEHIHWDQASALVQLGLLDPTSLPIAGVETAGKMLDPRSVPSNLLMKRTIADEEL